jgi:hypothetical protein
MVIVILFYVIPIIILGSAAVFDFLILEKSSCADLFFTGEVWLFLSSTPEFGMCVTVINFRHTIS